VAAADDLNHFVVAQRARNVKRKPAVFVTVARVRAGDEQRASALGVAQQRTPEEARASVQVLSVDVSSAVDEAAQDLYCVLVLWGAGVRVKEAPGARARNSADR
jgi:hypothetical protein